MANPPRQKGTAFETAVVRYLNSCGFNVERRALSGNQDKGDIRGVPEFVLECKATKAIDLAGFVDQTTAESINAGEPYGACIIKRRQKSVDAAYVVMPLWQFAELLSERECSNPAERSVIA